MKKTILAILAVFMFAFASIAYADTIENGFELDIGGDIDDDVKPGDSFSIEVEARNNNSADIENIEVEITIKDIDDGDDLDDDGELDDLDSGDKDSVDFEFEAPLAVDDQNYDVEIIVTGDDADNSSRDYRAVWNGSINVKKDKHALVMKQPTADMETLKCNRVTDLVTTIYNIGTKDEDIDLIVSNTQLGINQKQSFSLDSGNDESDIKATKRISVDLTNAAPGTYSMLVRAEYDEGDEQESATVSLKVEDCATSAVNQTKEDEDVIVQPTQPTTPVNVVPAIVEEPAFMEQYGAALLLGLAYLVVIVIGVLLVVNILRKR